MAIGKSKSVNATVPPHGGISIYPTSTKWVK
jgi:hypothetical protein